MAVTWSLVYGDPAGAADRAVGVRVKTAQEMPVPVRTMDQRQQAGTEVDAQDKLCGCPAPMGANLTAIAQLPAGGRCRRHGGGRSAAGWMAWPLRLARPGAVLGGDRKS